MLIICLSYWRNSAMMCKHYRNILLQSLCNIVNFDNEPKWDSKWTTPVQPCKKFKANFVIFGKRLLTWEQVGTRGHHFCKKTTSVCRSPPGVMVSNGYISNQAHEQKTRVRIELSSFKENNRLSYQWSKMTTSYLDRSKDIEIGFTVQNNTKLPP